MSNPNIPIGELVNGYIHEVGNILSYILTDGKSYTAFGKPKPEGYQGNWWDNDSGYQLQECVKSWELIEGWKPERK